ncbi:MAG: universal stress protein [Actinomycetota bacterium]|nr:universal stress protein [Actinomycetota bacterium]
MSATATSQPYTVVVGVSATSKSPAALTWAAAQAKANRGHLIAVRVLKRPPFPDASTTPPSESHQTQARTAQQAELEADVAEALGSEHGAECRVLHGGKRSSLLAVAEEADLLVIDAARTPSSSSLLAHRIIAAAGCPVVILPPALTQESPSTISRAGRAVGQAALRALGTSGRPGYRPPERR